MKRCGEIVETTTVGFVAESLELNRPPALGSLVKVDNPDGSRVYGIVSYGMTTALEPGRRAIRRSTDEVYDQAVYKEHPELSHILRTEFAVILVGCEDERGLWQHLPSQPPPLHYSVYSCSPQEVQRFSQRLDYFRLILSSSGPISSEQLLAAHIREVYQRNQDDNWLLGAARAAASLLKEDHARLIAVLQGIDPEAMIERP